MNLTSDLMELRETDIVKHYPAANAMLAGFDHSPRIGTAKEAAKEEVSSGLGTRRRFRSTTPGLVTRQAARAEGVHLVETILAADEEDPLPSPLQSTVLHALRRALSIGLAVGEAFSEATGLADLRRANLAGSLDAARKGEFTEFLAAEALAVSHVFANACAFLLAPHSSEVSVDLGEVEEVLTDNAQLALHGALWELEQDIAALAPDDVRLVAAVT
ncbi:MAG: AAA family ATPase, partial [Pseudomonadota bacterium]